MHADFQQQHLYKARAAGDLSAKLASEGLGGQGSERYLGQQGLYNATGRLSNISCRRD